MNTSQINPLVRAEFTIPGAATLVAFIWLIGAVTHLFGAAPMTFLVSKGHSVANGGPATVAAIVIAIGATYVVGIVVVMLTFLWPVGRILRNVRAARIEKLRSEQPTRSLASHLAAAFDGQKDSDQFRQPVESEDDPDADHSSDRWWHLLRQPHPESYNLPLILTHARATASDSVMNEYAYRRSIRQLAAGALPATVLATAVGPLTDWSILNIHSLVAWIILDVIWLAVGAISISSLMAAVAYQEKIAQSLLVDVAYMNYCENAPDSHASGDATPDEARRCSGEAGASTS